MLFRAVGIAVVLLAISPTLRANDARVEPVGPFSAEGASEALLGALEDRGYRVHLEDGTVACDIWFRKSLPVQGKSDASGVYYGQIPESALMGVVSLESPATDFRGQGIPAGSYTLRYSLHPQDGNHLGISTYRDFLLLSPIAEDRDPDARPSFEQVTEMSAKVAGTNHPTALSLTYPPSEPEQPAVVKNDYQHSILLVRVKTASGDLPLAIVVKGMTEH